MTTRGIIQAILSIIVLFMMLSSLIMTVSATPAGSEGWMTGEMNTDLFGWNVSAAGDVNDDGIEDLIVGAPGNDNVYTDGGAVFVFFGGSQSFQGLDATDANITLYGLDAGDAFGWDVACAGDVDDDGIDEVIIGAPGNDSAGSNAGAAYVYNLDGGGPYTFSAYIGGETGDRFGSSVTGLGDVDSDGFDDYAVGAYLNDSLTGNSVDQGAVYTFHGNDSLLEENSVLKANMTLNWGGAGDWFGYSVCEAGDLTGDGNPDMLVGAPFADAGSTTDAGAMYVYADLFRPWGWIYYDDIESTSGWGTTTTNSFTFAYDSTDSNSGTWCISNDPYEDDDDEYCSPLREFDLTHSTSARLSFWHRYKTDSSGPSWDDLTVEISESPYSEWFVLEDYDSTTLTPWTYEQIDLDSYYGSVVKVRFRVFSDSSNTGSWFIDDVGIQCYPDYNVPPYDIVHGDTADGLLGWSVAADRTTGIFAVGEPGTNKVKGFSTDSGTIVNNTQQDFLNGTRTDMSVIQQGFLVMNYSVTPETGFPYSFEGDTVGTQPSGWSVTADPFTSATVRTTTASVGSQSVRITDTRNTRMVYMEDSFSQLKRGVVDFDWYSTSEAADHLTCILYNGSASTGQPVTQIFLSNYSSLALMGYWDGSDDNFFAFYQKDTWYHMTIMFNCTMNVYDVYLDGVLVVADAPMLNGGGWLDTISFETFTASQCPAAYIDNVTVGQFEYEPISYFESRSTIASQQISSVYPVWDEILQYEEIIVNVSRDGGTTWAELTSYQPYHFTNLEPAGSNLRFNVTMKSDGAWTPYFGNMQMTYVMTVPEFTLTGQSGTAFGSSIEFAQDFDTDGDPEIIVGAPKAGQVYVFNLYPSMLPSVSYTSANFTYSEENAGDRFGQSVCIIEGLQGDTLKRVVCGAPYYDRGAITDAGRTYIYSYLLVDHFYVSTLTGTHAGASFRINVTAKDGSNVTLTDWSGVVDLDAVLPDGVTPATGTLQTASVTISNGYGEVWNQYYVAETIRINASQGSFNFGVGPSITVDPGPMYDIQLAQAKASFSVADSSYNLNSSTEGYDQYGNLNSSWAQLWEINDTGSASIAQTGVFTPGTKAETFYAWCNDTRSSASNYTRITIRPGPLYSITLEYTEIEASVEGTTLDLNRSTNGWDVYSNMNNSWNENWECNATQGSSIDQDGELTIGNTVDTFWIWCNNSAGSVSNHTKVTLRPGVLDRIEMAYDEVWLTAGGTAFDLNTTTSGYDSYDNINQTWPRTWETNAPGATVDADGVFTPGTVAGTYTVWLNSTVLPIGNSTTVHIKPDQVASIAMQYVSVNAVAGGSAVDLNATTHGYDQFGNLNDSWDWTWSTNQTDGSVDGTGSFSPGNEAGAYAVNVSNAAGTVTNTTNVYVLPDSLHHIRISPQGPMNVTTDDLLNFRVYGFDQYENPVGVLAVNWSLTSNLGDIAPSYGVDGAFQPKTVGTCKVQATYGPFLTSTHNITISSGALTYIQIHPTAVGAATTDDVLSFKSYGFDKYWNGLGPTSVNWTVLGGVGVPTNTTGNATSIILNSPGTGRVRAQWGYVFNQTNEFIVDLGEPKEIILDPGGDLTLTTDDMVLFNATARDRWGNGLGPVNVTWAVIGGIGNVSQGPSINATFDPTTVGNGIIAATLGSIANTTGNITVLPGALHRLTISPKETSVVVDQTTEFTITPTDADGNLIPITGTIWTATEGFIESYNDTWARFKAPNQIVTDVEVKASGLGMSVTALVDVFPSGEKPEIVGIIPDQIKFEDNPIWSLDMKNFEPQLSRAWDIYWYVTDVNESLISIGGQMSDESVLTFIPVANAFGSCKTTFWLSTKEGLTDSQVVWINLTPVNDPPIMETPPDLVVCYDKPYAFDYTPYIYDGDDDISSLSLVATEASGDGNIIVSDLTAVYTFGEDYLNTHVIVTLSISDGKDETMQAIQITVTNDNPPELMNPLPDVIINEGELKKNVFSLNSYFTDPDQEVIFFTSRTKHVVVNINEDSSVDISSPSEWTGVENVTFRAIDGAGALAEDTISVTVIPFNDPPEIGDVPDLFVHYDADYKFSLRPYVWDVDTPLSKLALTFDSVYVNVSEDDHLTMVLNYPQSMLGGPYPLMITLTDGTSVTSTIIDVTVSDNWPPELHLSLPDVTLYEDESAYDHIDLHDFFFDRDADEMYYSYGQKQIEVHIDDETGKVDFILPENWYGSEEITFRATDSRDALIEDTIKVTVVPVNDAPVVKRLPDQIGNQSTMWKLDMTQYVSDVDNNVTTLEIWVSTGNFTELAVVVAGTELVFFGNTPAQGQVTVFISDGVDTTSTVVNVTVVEAQTTVDTSDPSGFAWWWFIPIIVALVLVVVVLLIVFKRSYLGAYRIEEAFIVDKHGMCLAHRSRSEDESLEMDEDLLSGMLKVIQDFVKDSFKKTKGDEAKLNMFKYGDTTVLIEQGDHVFLAVFFTGQPGKRLEGRIANFLKDLEAKNKDTVANWDGDTNSVIKLDRMLSKLVKSKGVGTAVIPPSSTSTPPPEPEVEVLPPAPDEEVPQILEPEVEYIPPAPEENKESLGDGLTDHETLANPVDEDIPLLQPMQELEEMPEMEPIDDPPPPQD